MLKTLVIAIALLASAASDCAKADEWQDSVKAIVTIALHQDEDQPTLLSMKRQIHLAKVVVQYCDLARNAIPSLTPDEEKWLDEELKTSGNRLMAAVDSSVFARAKLVDLYDACLDWSRLLAQMRESDRTSIYLWAGLVNVMIQTKPREYLERIGGATFPKDKIGGADFILEWIATAALTRVIIPATKP